MYPYKHQIIIHHIFTSPEHHYFTREKFCVGNAPTIEHTSIELYEGKGLEGDRFEFSKYPITLFSLEVAQDVCKTLGVELDVKLFRRNIIVSGIHLNSLIGKRFMLGDVECEGLAHCSPCTWMNAVFKKGAFEAMRGRGGLRIKVLKGGVLSSSTTDILTAELIDENPLIPIKRAKIPTVL